MSDLIRAVIGLGGWVDHEVIHVYGLRLQPEAASIIYADIRSHPLIPPKSGSSN